MVEKESKVSYINSQDWYLDAYHNMMVHKHTGNVLRLDEYSNYMVSQKPVYYNNSNNTSNNVCTITAVTNVCQKNNKEVNKLLLLTKRRRG